MSQTKVDFSQNPTGPQLMDDYLAKMQENVLTTNSGVTRPEYAKQGTLWIDMSTTPWLLKVYDGSQDITLGKIDINNDKFISSNPMTTTGDITVQGADGNPARLAPGTEGYVLMSNGAGKLPSYRDVGSEYARADSVVKLTGDQTVTGIKTFTNPIIVQRPASGYYYLKNTDLDILTNPSANQAQYIVWRDKNNKDMSYVSQSINTSGVAELWLTASTYKTDGTRVQGHIKVAADRNGNVWTVAPTPPTADDSTKVATTAWVNTNTNSKLNTKFQVVSALPSSPTSGVFYFVKE